MASSPVAPAEAGAKVMQGVLEMKEATGLTDSWGSFKCEYSQSTKAFAVKFSDGQADVWTKDVEGAWVLEAKPGRRVGRFDVMMTSGEVVSFAAPTGELAAEWIKTIKDAALAEEDSFGALSPTSGSSSPISSNKSLPPSTAASSKSGTSASEEPVSLLTALTPEPDSPEVAHWKEAYAAATSSAGVTELDEAAFLALVRSEMPADEGANQPMVDDLKGAFAVADADRSGKVDGPEFVRLMQLVADGEVHGLSSAVFFQKAGRDAKFKSELAAAKARDARNVAALEAAKAAAVVEEARMAEAKASEAKRSSEAVLPATEAEKAETKWRAMFHAALKEGAVDLDRAEFVVLVKKAMVREVMMANEGVRAESGNRVAMPLDADLEAAFAVADTDQNGTVDADEFVKLMELIKGGKVAGLGSSGIFGFGRKTAQFKEDLASAQAAAAAKKEAELASAARGDPAAVAREEAQQASERAKAAVASAKRAEEEAKQLEASAAEAAVEAQRKSNGFLGLGRPSVDEERVKEAAKAQRKQEEEAKKAREEALIEAARKMAEEAAAAVAAAEEAAAAEAAAAKAFNVKALLADYGLEEFASKLDDCAVETFTELRGCTDIFLGHQLLMSKVQVLRFRRALMDQRLDPHFPSDNTGAKVAIYEAHDGWRGTLEEVNAHEEKLVAKKKAIAKAKKEKKYRTYSIYESDIDGFRGSYAEVIAHDKKLKQKEAKPVEPHHDRVLIRIYEAEDGFRGTYEEVAAHEVALASGLKPQQVKSEEVRHLYEAPDGFRGTFEEVSAHEEILGLKYCEETNAVISHEPDGPQEPAEGDDAKVQDLLMDIGLGHFAVPFHKVGVDYQVELEGCTDEFLVHQVGLKSVQLAKFRKAFPDETENLPEVSQDHYRGTSQGVLDHNNKLKRLQLGLSPFKAPSATSTPVVPVDLYEAPDGFRGTFEEVSAHELHNLGHTFDGDTVKPHPDAPTTKSVLQPLDLNHFEQGFTRLGIHVASELKGCSDAYLKGRVGMSPEEIAKFREAVQDTTAAMPETASDGFKGSEFEVLNHEAKAKEEAQRLAAATSAAAPALEPHHDRVLIRIYEAEDGFTGTYDEVLAHEQKMGLTSGIGHAATVQHVLGSKAGGLASFVDLFHKNGIDNASELEGCTDAFLAEKIGMSPAQVTQFRQVVPDSTANMPETCASDGYKGASADNVANHERKLAAFEVPSYDRVLMRVYAAEDGFTGSYEEVLEHEAKLSAKKGEEGAAEDKNDAVLFRLYAAVDGFTGTYEEVAAHEAKFGLKSGEDKSAKEQEEEKEKDKEETLYHIYEAVDGFRGSYDEVVAYERSHGIEPGNEADTEEMAHTYALYQCVDGFRGSKEECMAHEKEANLPDPSEYAANTLTVAPPALHHDVVLLRIYESEDGFRGTYDEVIAHEEKVKNAMPSFTAYHKPEAAKEYAAKMQDAIATQTAELDALKQRLLDLQAIKPSAAGGGTAAEEAKTSNSSAI